MVYNSVLSKSKNGRRQYVKSAMDDPNRHSAATDRSMILHKRITSNSKQKQDALSTMMRPKVIKQSQSFINQPHRDRSISSMEIKKVRRLNLRSIIGQEAKADMIRVPSDSPEKNFNDSKRLEHSQQMYENTERQPVYQFQNNIETRIIDLSSFRNRSVRVQEFTSNQPSKQGSIDTPVNERDQSLVNLQLMTKISNGPKNQQDESRGSLNQHRPVNTQEELEMPPSNRVAERQVQEEKQKYQPILKELASRGTASARYATSKKKNVVGPKFK